jgi:hypothetical protein
MKKRILVVAAIAALAIPASASATFWSWGYNYLGPSTDNGLCPPTVPAVGRVCSGSANWFQNYMDKRNGGTVCLGFANNTTSSCLTWTGVVVITDKPGYEGISNPSHSQLTYESGNRSYLYNSATT